MLHLNYLLQPFVYEGFDFNVVRVTFGRAELKHQREIRNGNLANFLTKKIINAIFTFVQNSYSLKKSIALFVFVFFSFASFSQIRSLEKRITYNQNGNSGSIDFRVNYDVFMGEPTRTVVAKVASYENCEPLKINIAVDIYNGVQKVSTVTYKNLISFDVAGSPDWDEVFPGVSAEGAKDLFTNGFSIRNARAVNLSFTGCASESSESNSDGDGNSETASNELQSGSSTFNSNNSNSQSNGNPRSEHHDGGTEKKVAEDAADKKAAEDAAKKKAAEDAAKKKAADEEAKRRAEQERRVENQRKAQEHQRQVQERTERNTQQAAAMAADNTSALVAIGMFMYLDMGKVKSDETYFGNQFYAGIDFGYSFSNIPVVFNSSTSNLTYDYVSGDNEYINGTSDDDRTAYTINIDLKPHLGYEHRYGGLEVYGCFQPGFSPIFDRFNLSHNWGGKVSVGLPKFKAVYHHERGTRRFTGNDWITDNEYGSLESRFKYKKQVLGLKFIRTSSGRVYARHHITIGHIFENFLEGLTNDDGQTTRAWFYNLDPAKKSEGDNKYKRIHGWTIEWIKEHNFTFYLNFYENYPFTGRSMYNQSSSFAARDNGGLFLELGFIRQIRSFY